MKIGVAGSINLDLMFEVNKIPKIGETIIANNYQILNGGKGANQAVIASSLNDEVVFLGAIGNDSFGEKALDNLVDKGLNKKDIFVKETNTGLAIIEVYNSNNTIVAIPGANNEISIKDIDYFLENNQDIKVIITQLEINYDAVDYLIRECKRRGIKIILNPAPARSLDDEIIELVDYFIPNEIEAKEILGSNDLDVLFGKLKSKLIVTLGDKGAAYYDGEVKIIPAKKIKVVDTTGAGDSFIAGFASGILRGRSVGESVELGIEVASITCSVFGAQSAYKIIKKDIKL